MYRVAHLSKTFMIVSILGLFVSGWIMYKEIAPSWGFTMLVIFGIMFIACFISMSKWPHQKKLRAKIGRIRAKRAAKKKAKKQLKKKIAKKVKKRKRR